MSVFCGHAIIPDMRGPTVDLDAYLERLRQLPFIKHVELHRPETADEEEDARLTIVTPKGRHDFAVEIKSNPATRGAAQHLIALAARNPARSWLLFSPYVSQPVAQLVASHNIGFVDQAGNCHISIDRDYVAHIEGRRPPLPPLHGRGLGARSYQVLFALLARPDLGGAPIRSLAEAAGVGKTAAADLMQRLREEGLLLRDKAGSRIVHPGVLLDRWVAGYADKLRPRLLVGRFRGAISEPRIFEQAVETTLTDFEWAWGGATAGYRLTQHYQSATTTLHVAAPTARMQRQLGLLPSKDGPIVILGTPGRLGLEGPAPHVAHPLLVYSELVLEGDERALEAASEIRGQFLGQIR
jgi:hypothetical protein